MRLMAGEILGPVKGKLLKGDPNLEILGISTDSNLTKAGDLFVPIKGLRTDGHKFIADAFKNGVTASLFSEDLNKTFLALPKNVALIRVDDTLFALQSLAAWYRKNYLSMPYIGVTGSLGKTTTSRMIALALSQAYRVYSTKGNENSQVGVPKTILATDPDSSIGVIEMGISEFGEMEKLSWMVKPDLAVVTCIGDSHIGNLKSRLNIMLEKLHICDFLPDHSILFLNGDDDLLKNVNMDFLNAHDIAKDKELDIRFFGSDSKAYYRASGYKETSKGIEYDFWVRNSKLCHVAIKLHGIHMMLNSLVGMATAYENGVDPKKAAEALSKFTALKGRGDIISINGINIINDAYNAAPQSMKAALQALDKYAAPQGKKVAVISDMLELGENELSFHEEIGKFIVDETKNIDLVLSYGELSRAYVNGMTNGKRKVCIYHFESYDKLLDSIHKLVKAGDTMLLKGSNSMKLWKIPDVL